MSPARSGNWPSRDRPWSKSTVTAHAAEGGRRTADEAHKPVVGRTPPHDRWPPRPGELPRAQPGPAVRQPSPCAIRSGLASSPSKASR